MIKLKFRVGYKKRKGWYLSFSTDDHTDFSWEKDTDTEYLTKMENGNFGFCRVTFLKSTFFSSKKKLLEALEKVSWVPTIWWDETPPALIEAIRKANAGEVFSPTPKN